MADLEIECTCGDTFIYNINLAPFLHEFESSNTIPIIVPHKGHFITVHIDEYFKVKKVEKIIMVDKQLRSTIASTVSLTEEQILEVITKIKKKIDPSKKHKEFATQINKEINEPEALFIAGKSIGYEMWKKFRKSIIELGARYQPIINLILKTEIKPVLDKIHKTKLVKDNQLEIYDSTIPELVIGNAQGILLGIGESAIEKMDIKIEYEITKNKVTLTLKNQ